ncbi:DNA polymerase alpha, subunit B [Ramicandelaber brevisporus]|nr:DNA polymerase alpha, subunit B [Ramicandelaber brevisporus]
MTMSSFAEALGKQFGGQLGNDQAALTEAEHLCRMHDLTPEQLFIKWERHALVSSSSNSEQQTEEGTDGIPATGNVQVMARLAGLAKQLRVEQNSSAAGVSKQPTTPRFGMDGGSNSNFVYNQKSLMDAVNSSGGRLTTPSMKSGKKKLITTADKRARQQFGTPSKSSKMIGSNLDYHSNAAAAAVTPHSQRIGGMAVGGRDLMSPLMLAKNTPKASTNNNSSDDVAIDWNSRKLNSGSVVASFNMHLPNYSASKSSVEGRVKASRARPLRRLKTDDRYDIFTLVKRDTGDDVEDYSVADEYASDGDDDNIVVLNEHSDDSDDDDNDDIFNHGNKSKSSSNKVRYMFERLDERSLYLDWRVDSAAQWIRGSNSDVDIVHPRSTCQSISAVVGRICRDPEESQTGRLALRASMFDTSRRLGGGNLVRLNLDNAALKGGLSLFPGQLVCLEGTNPLGKEFHVESVTPLPMLPAASPAISDDSESTPLRIMLACGPFTCDDSLNYAVLEELMKQVSLDPPEHLLLMGPFVDSVNPLVAIGDMLCSPDDLFKDILGTCLIQLSRKYPNMGIAVIPSTRDVVHPYVCFPQPPFDPAQLGLPILPNVQYLPNPAVYEVRGTVIGVSTADALSAISSTELHVSGSNSLSASATTGEQRMVRLCHHILEQRSMYPVFPPEDSSNDPVPLALAPPELACYLDLTAKHQPHLMIMPSKLKQFAVESDGTVFVNPGNACTAKAAGTFARIVVHPAHEKYTKVLIPATQKDVEPMEVEDDPFMTPATTASSNTSSKDASQPVSGLADSATSGPSRFINVEIVNI